MSMPHQPSSGEPRTRSRDGEPLSNPPATESRRSALAQLPTGLHSVVVETVRRNARVMIDNYKILKDRPDGLAGLLGEEEASRLAAAKILQALERVRTTREHTESISDVVTTGESLLTDNGRAQSVRKAAKKHVSDDGRRFAKPLGQYKGAVSAEPGELLALNPDFKVGSQVRQVLGHLSQVFMNEVNDMEYQSMLVNDRVLVAANDPAMIEAFRTRKLRELLDEVGPAIVAENTSSDTLRPYRISGLSDALRVTPDESDSDSVTLTDRQKVGVEMLTELEFGHHIDHDGRADLASLLALLQKQSLNPLPMTGPVSPERAAGLITESDKYSVILVKTGNKAGWHAEQILAMTLIQAGWRQGATVSGTKSPCYYCWLTLNLLPQCGYPINFEQAPGFMWDTNTIPALTKVAKALGIQTTADLEEAFVRARVHTNDEFRQFMTSLVERKDLAIDVAAGAATEPDLTQAQSRRSFTIASQVPVDDDPPPSPPGYYGSPEPEDSDVDVDSGDEDDNDRPHKKRKAADDDE